MTQPVPVPPVRRPLLVAAEGLAIDVAAAAVLAVGPAIADEHFAWSGPYWASIGLLAAKTAIQTGVAWLTSRAAMRR